MQIQSNCHLNYQQWYVTFDKKQKKNICLYKITNLNHPALKQQRDSLLTAKELSHVSSTCFSVTKKWSSH